MKHVRIALIKPSRADADRLRAAQQEAAACWNICVEEHKNARQNHEKWPGLKELHQVTKGRFALHSQTVQQVVRSFLGAIETTQKLRKKGDKKIRYPYREKRYFPVMWPRQAMAVYEKKIVLPMGRGRKSVVIPRPDEMPDEGAASKIVWNKTGYEFHWVLETEDHPMVEEGNLATVDLGQIHQAAIATNTGGGAVISGRGIRSEKRGFSKTIGRISKKQSRCTKYSRRWRKLQRSKNRQILKYKRRIRDLRHKGTRAAIDFCTDHGVSSIYVGNPDGVRRNHCGRHHNQRMSQWEYGKDISYLKQKARMAGIMCSDGTERGTSSHCPVCGHRHKPNGRVWTCKKCGFQGHRDIVGAVNMHGIGFGTTIEFPHWITYLRPGSTSVGQAARMKNSLSGSSSGLDTGHGLRTSADRVAEPEHGRQPPASAEQLLLHGQDHAQTSEAHSF